jgi:hypothetical protein
MEIRKSGKSYWELCRSCISQHGRGINSLCNDCGGGSICQHGGQRRLLTMWGTVKRFVKAMLFRNSFLFAQRDASIAT